MKIVIKLEMPWAMFLLIVVLGCAIVAGTILGLNVESYDRFYIICLLSCMVVLVTSIFCLAHQDYSKVAIKAMETNLELEKYKWNKERRDKEDEQCDGELEKQRLHEIKLAKINNLIKVEVSNV